MMVSTEALPSVLIHFKHYVYSLAFWFERFDSKVDSLAVYQSVKWSNKKQDTHSVGKIVPLIGLAESCMHHPKLEM